MFKEEEDPSFRQNQKVVSTGLSVSQSARAQKWLDQLVQVESRMLSNWEEFSSHRAEVQQRFCELTEQVRRKQEPHLENELEKCTRRLQQLSSSNEEALCRMGDLKTAVENGQQSLEGLRLRVSTKLQELGSSLEEQKKDLLSRVSEELQAEASSSKRQSKALAEELLRKMKELNEKLGENMSAVEEESISRFEGLRGDVQALTKRLDAVPRPEVELRKTEAYFESQLRSLRAEMHSQLEELAAASSRSENARVKGLQENTQELTQRLEKVALEAASGKSCAERLEVQVQELRQQQRVEMEEQLEKLRDELAVKAGKESKAQSEAVAQLARKLQHSEEVLERCCATASEVEVLKIADGDRAMVLEQLGRSCSELAETRQGFLAEVDGCRSANRQLEDSLRRMDGRVESLSSTATHCSEGLTELKAATREADKSQAQFREILEKRTSELQELLERRGHESSKMEALRLADAERQRQLEQLSMACETLAEARQGIVAEVESCRSIDRQMEEALRRLDAKVERASGQALQCSEGVADVKAFARELSEKVLSQSRDFMEKRHAEMKELIEQQVAEQGSKMEALKLSDSECHQQLDFLSRALAELSEARRGIFAEVESCQSSDRKLEEHLRRMENKLDRLSSTTSQCSEGVNEAKALAQQSAEKAQIYGNEQLELRTRELKDHLKHLRDELSSNFAKEAKGQSEALAQLARKQELQGDSLQAGTADLRRTVEAQFRRQEQLERQAGESANALQAVQVLVVERGQQLERLSKTSSELSEAWKGVADVKAFAREQAERVLQQSRQLMDSSVQEVKEQLERRSTETSVKIEALKSSGLEHQQQLDRLEAKHQSELSETKKGLLGEVEKCQSVERQLEDALKRLDGKMDKLADLAGSREGVTEVKSFARQAVENVLLQSREVLDQRTGEMKARSEALNEELRALRLFVQEENQRHVQAGRVEATEREHRLSSQLMTHAQEQLEKLRDELAVKAGKESKAQSEAVAQLARKLQHSEEVLERCATASEVEVLKTADAERATALEQLSRSCKELAETRQGFLAEVDGCRSANRQLEDSLRRMDSRVDSLSSTATHCSEGLTELKAAAREADKSQAQFREILEQRTSELQELVDRRAHESSAKMEALRSADAERQRHLEQLSMACETLAEARQGIVAEVESCRSIDRQMEEALRRLDAKVERVNGQALQCSEGVADVKAFARELSEKVLSQSREFMEKRHAEIKELVEQQVAEQGSKMEALKLSDSECHQQLDSLSRNLAELSEARRGIFAEVESCQSSDRKLEEHLRRMENKLDRLSSTTSQCSEGVNEAKALAQQSAEKAQAYSNEQLELRSRELKDHLKQLRDELSSNVAKEAKGQSEALSQLARKQELQGDSLEAGTSDLRRNVEAQARRQEQLERQAGESANALQALQVQLSERGQQLERISKSCGELSEGMADVKAFAREGAERVQQQSRQLMESSVLEVKEQLERRSAETSVKIEALKSSELEHQRQLDRLEKHHTELSETKKGLLGEVEKCQSVERQLEDALKRLDGKVDKLADLAGGTAEGVTEVKAFARQAVENVLLQSREVYDPRLGEMKARSEALNEELRALRLFVQEESQRQVQAGRAEATEREHRLSSRLMTQAQEAQELRSVLDEQLKRQENLSAELREAQEVFHGKVSKVSTEFAEQKDSLKKYITDALRKSEQKLQALTAQPRVLALVMDELEGVVRGVAQRELQVFQREALDSMEWKLERCVQWLHGANVKLGLNPQGTLFSTDRFREMLFEEAEPTTPGSHPQSARGPARVRSASRGRS